MKYIYFLFIIFLLSCGSTTTDSDSFDEDGPVSVNEDRQVSERKVVKKLPPKSLNYSREFDRIRLSSASGLQRETLDGISFGVSKNSNDDILAITSSCRSGNYSAGQGKAASLYNKYKSWPTFWNAVGLCYYLQGNLYSAKLFFSKAIKAEVNYGPALNNLGLTAIKEQKWYEALSFFKDAKRYNARSQVASYNLGRLYLAFGHGNKAVQYFSQINDKNFFKKKVSGKLGIAYSLAGNHKKAISLLENEVGSSESMRLFYSYSLAKIGQKAKARSIYSTLQIGRGNPNYNLYQDVKRMIQ